MEQMLSTARDFAAQGRWLDAWVQIESLTPEQRVTPEVSVLRLACCAELKSWDIGKAVAAILAEDLDDVELQKAVGRFHYELAIHEMEIGRMRAAVAALKQAFEHAPDLFYLLMRDDRTGPLLRYPYPSE